MNDWSRLYVICISLAALFDWVELQFVKEVDDCTDLGGKLKVWKGFLPKGANDAGKYNQILNVDFDGCVAKCCLDQSCNVVFTFNNSCFNIECVSDDSCEPVYQEEEKFKNARIVIVRRQPVSLLSSYDTVPEDALQGDLLAEASELVLDKYCDIKDPVCGVNENCELSKLANAGICVCRPGYVRDIKRDCVLPVSSSNPSRVSSSSPETTPHVAPAENASGKIFAEAVGASTSSPPKKLAVSVVSKTIRVPENEVSLSAFVVPAELEGGPSYAYKWKLLSQPEGSERAMSETHGGTLTLSHLTEGVYIFEVTVSGPGLFGQATANVTVLPQKRENEPPTAIVLPSYQVVKLPNSRAVLEASSSTDDEAITKFHWELVQRPVGYQPNLTDTQTLDLKDLHYPGNYTFRLTVTDSDGATNSTTANITVLQVPDYPPEANAGPSIILYLPRNNVTLNGSLSSDDKGIQSWEWTKGPSDQDKAVDMQNTHTPYLQLSHLEEGMYTFVLKVTDDAGQSSTNSVHVFVKPPTNSPPKAEAGSNQTISLPQTWVVLNGSLSTDDISITRWTWEMISGPTKVTFTPANESFTNVTGLTKGAYQFKLTVMDGNENTASDTVSITVNQNKNTPPKANAGKDQIVDLPIGVLIMNGSESSDDLGIAKWQWTRELTSLAMGTIIDQSDTSPVLMVTNVVPGRYEFRLRVTDDQGEWAEDTVSIIVRPDPETLNLVELTLNIEAGKLIQSQRDSVLVKLGMLLRDASQLVVRDLKSDETGRAKLIFYVSSPSGSVPGPQVVETLKAKLAQDSFLLQLSVVHIQTVICQNNCSGHGVCDQETRSCLCETFWMHDLHEQYFGSGESTCGWSVLYVAVGFISLLVVLLGSLWAVACICAKVCVKTPREKTRYSLLDNTEQVRLSMGKVPPSDSDTDSDVLFENRTNKSNGVKFNRNGYKQERRVKT